MTIRPICITGDPVLHSPAAPVTRFDDDLQELLTDMVDTMRAAPGVGLAAPQIGVSQQVFVWEWTDEDGVLHQGAVINPTLNVGPLEKRTSDPEGDLEGCLSVPDFRFPLSRANRVVLRGTTPQQTPPPPSHPHQNPHVHTLTKTHDPIPLSHPPHTYLSLSLSSSPPGAPPRLDAMGSGARSRSSCVIA